MIRFARKRRRKKGVEVFIERQKERDIYLIYLWRIGSKKVQ